MLLVSPIINLSPTQSSDSQKLCDGDKTDQAFARFIGKDSLHRIASTGVFHSEFYSTGGQVGWRSARDTEERQFKVSIGRYFLLSGCDGILGSATPDVNIAEARKALDAMNDQGLTAITITTRNKLVAVLGMNAELQVCQ
jgi:hypothetical protein